MKIGRRFVVLRFHQTLEWFRVVKYRFVEVVQTPVNRRFGGHAGFLPCHREEKKTNYLSTTSAIKIQLEPNKVARTWTQKKHYQ